MKLVPLADRVVLKQCKAEETTKSGIFYKSDTGKTTAGRGYRSRSWRNG